MEIKSRELTLKEMEKVDGAGEFTEFLWEILCAMVGCDR